jgi:hypothetical protein
MTDPKLLNAETTLAEVAESIMSGTDVLEQRRIARALIETAIGVYEACATKHCGGCWHKSPLAEDDWHKCGGFCRAQFEQREIARLRGELKKLN